MTQKRKTQAGLVPDPDRRAQEKVARFLIGRGLVVSNFLPRVKTHGLRLAESDATRPGLKIVRFISCPVSSETDAARTTITSLGRYVAGAVMAYLTGMAANR